MVRLKDINPAISEARLRVEEAQAKLKEIEQKIQESCAHRVVASTPYVPMKFFDDSPPARICYHCGLEEHGRHFNKLSNPEIMEEIKDRDEFYKLRNRK